MATVATVAQGSDLKVGNGATPTEAFTTIAEVITINGPDRRAEEIDVTNHDSPSGSREFVRGPVDNGSLTFDVNLDPSNTQHAQVFNDLNTVPAPSRNYELHLGASATHKLTFTGFINAAPITANTGDVIKMQPTIRLTGAVTLTTV